MKEMNGGDAMYLNDDRDDVAFLTGSGSSESGRAYSKRDLYERGHVAVCSHKQAICITVFVFSSILLSSLAIAFARPWNDCGPPDLLGTGISPEEDVGPPIATNGEVFPWDNIRLPIFIRPVSYDLELSPNLTTLAVKGIIKLIFQVTEETDFIVFHIKDINITSKTINEKLKVSRLLELREREQMYLETDEPMRPGKMFSVRLKFEYNLTRGLEGFYISSYKDKSGVEHLLATTHFEPTYARKAFPCFDEPQLKAEFTMTINHDKKLTSFFNMPVKEVTGMRGKPDRENQGTHKVRNEFHVTEKMSTYLVAFVICDFKTKQEFTKTNNITVKVAVAEDKLEQADFALKTATNITEYYEHYFGIPYPLPKQDLIAIPDFGAGAMENWGLITYRETSLLYSEGSSSASAKQWVAIVVAHELAHQWFGNLVTMKWWNDLWLNEGFASWMEYKGVAEAQPEWAMEEQFWVNKLMPALKLDSLASSHPVSMPVQDPKEIEAIFDTISYKKGSSIIHMLEHSLGESTLRAGLKNYLKKHEFDNAVTRDLWRALGAAANGRLDVEAMMDTWTVQMGYPLISFEKADGSATGWCVKQKHFLASESSFASSSAANPKLIQSLPPSKYNYTWFVPVELITDLSVDKPVKVFLNATHNASNGHIELPQNLKWIKANLGGGGYYRVQYPPEVWSALIAQLRKEDKVLSATDRAQLLDDAFSLCLASQLDHGVPLEMATTLQQNEESLGVWQAVLHHLHTWAHILTEGPGREGIHRMLVKITSEIYTKLGWKDEGSHVRKLLRQKILTSVLDAGHPEAIKKAKELFDGQMAGKAGVAANLQELVYSVGVREGGAKEWKWCWDRYTSTNVPSERGNLLRALGETRDVFTIQKYLDMTLNQTEVRGQDVQTVLAAVASNPAGRLPAWRHLQRHWEKIFEQFHSGSFTMGHIIASVASHFSTQFDFDQVQAFFADKDVGAGKLVLRQTLEQIQVNIEFRRQSEKGVDAWLEHHFPPATSTSQ